MQIISTSSYNDINICNPLDGTNIMTNDLQQFTAVINSSINSILNPNDISCIYNSEGAFTDTVYNIYLFQVRLKVDKSLLQNIKYYWFAERFSANDPECYINASNNSIDYIDVVWFNSKKYQNYDKVRLHLRSFDYNDKEVYGAKVTGVLNVYPLC